MEKNGTSRSASHELVIRSVVVVGKCRNSNVVYTSGGKHRLLLLLLLEALAGGESETIYNYEAERLLSVKCWYGTALPRGRFQLR